MERGVSRLRSGDPKTEVLEELDALEPFARGLGSPRRRVLAPVLRPCLALRMVAARGASRGAPSRGRGHGAGPPDRGRAVVHHLGAPRGPRTSRASARRSRAASSRWPLRVARWRSPGDRRDPLAVSANAPDVVCFDGIDDRSRWPGDLAGVWPGGPAAILTRYESPMSSLSLRGEAGFSSWFAGKSRNFRKDLRRDWRRFQHRGGRVRMVTPETLERDLCAFARLHRARWDNRGGSVFLSRAVERMLDRRRPDARRHSGGCGSGRWRSARRSSPRTSPSPPAPSTATGSRASTTATRS